MNVRAELEDLFKATANYSATIILSSTLIGILFAVMAVMSKRDPSKERDPMNKIKQTPQPKWHVLQVLNYLVLAVFVSTITFVITNYRDVVLSNHVLDTHPSLLNSGLLPFVIVWSICLAYFFGFFGISFLDTDALSPSTSSNNLEEMTVDLSDISSPETIVRKPLKVLQTLQIRTPGTGMTTGSAVSGGASKPTHNAQAVKPMNDTPICGSNGFIMQKY